mmetsp:Transcript_10049/g.14162  ORF Transcript_10049/g.14162 Transcript_10049/m.14162 type:complete len:388 (+) Transcript_10049:25-1188(+)
MNEYQGNSAGFSLPFKLPKFSDISDKVGDLLGTGEFSNRVGEMVMNATSETLISADYSLNMAISDSINSSLENTDFAAKAIQRRLKSDNSKVVSLTMTLCDVCFKNGDQHVHIEFQRREFLEHFLALYHNKELDSEVKKRALEMVKEWSESCQNSHLNNFKEYYQKMKNKVNPSNYQHKNAAKHNFAPNFNQFGMSPGESNAPLNPAQEMIKLKVDLVCVREKAELCQEILQHSPGVEHDEVLWELVGFLEACQPRLLALIQSGSSGILEPVVMEACLKLNDYIFKTLEAEKNHIPIIEPQKIDIGFGLECAKESAEEGRQDVASQPIFSNNNFTISDEDGDEDYEPLKEPNLLKEKDGEEKVEEKKGESNLDNDLEEFESFLNSRP